MIEKIKNMPTTKKIGLIISLCVVVLLIWWITANILKTVEMENEMQEILNKLEELHPMEIQYLDTRTRNGLGVFDPTGNEELENPSRPIENLVAIECRNGEVLLNSQKSTQELGNFLEDYYNSCSEIPLGGYCRLENFENLQHVYLNDMQQSATYDSNEGRLVEEDQCILRFAYYTE